MKSLIFICVIAICTVNYSIAAATNVDGLFKNEALVEATINGALKEGSIAGYHGSLNKAYSYLQESKNSPDDTLLYSFIAWWNLIEAKLILDEAAAMPSKGLLADKSNKSLLKTMAIADEARRKIEKNVFQWNSETSFSMFQSGYLRIKEKLGISPVQQ